MTATTKSRTLFKNNDNTSHKIQKRKNEIKLSIDRTTENKSANRSLQYNLEQTNEIMGSSSSKTSSSNDASSKPKSFVDNIKNNVQDEITKRMMIQREVQMAVNIARARDNIYIFGSVYLTFVTGLTTAKLLLKKPVPTIAGIPVVIGGVMLSNLIDMAYGNKLGRINKEAEYILNEERYRLVPMSQAPMSKYYTDYERSLFFDQATPVGDMFPYNLTGLTRSRPQQESQLQKSSNK